MTELSRRNFIKSSAAFAGFAVAVSNTPALLAADQSAHDGIGACMRFGQDGLPVLCVPTPDMGQGMMIVQHSFDEYFHRPAAVLFTVQSGWDHPRVIEYQ